MPVVNYRLDGNVAVLEIDNPPVNAASIKVREAFAEALKNAASDPVVEAVVIAGARGIFLAGADIKEVASGLSNKFPTLRDLQAQMEAVPKPIVAAIRGAALGGGFEIALACHWRIAARTPRSGCLRSSSEFCPERVARSGSHASQARTPRSMQLLPAIR